MLRQQDVIENPVREITAQKEGGCDWRTNYRKCSVSLSSCMYSMFGHIGKVGLCCFCFRFSKLKDLVLDKITCVILCLNSADESDVVHM